MALLCDSDNGIPIIICSLAVHHPKMMASSVLPLLACASCLFRVISGTAVFAHYMLGKVTQAHAEQDVDDAMAMGLDAFALIIGGM